MPIIVCSQLLFDNYNLSFPFINCLAFANSVDPDQLASSEANWSGSTLFAIQYLNLYQQPGSSNLIGWKLDVGVTSWFVQHEKGYDDRMALV